MSFSSRSSGRRHYGDNHRGSSYYKREGLFSRIAKMLGSFSSSHRRYNNHHSHYSDQGDYSEHSHHHKRKYKSSWS